MKVTIKSKYLVFPVNTTTEKKRMEFIKLEKPVYGLNIQLDNLTPNFYAYIDVSVYKGETLDITVSPEMDIVFRETDTMDIPGLYQEPLRPQIHFSTKNGWINDPNGLVYWNGVYHMFYQHNPAAPTWENMHWGHAVSKDLIHWEEKDIALFPDERGTMWSGSAIVDKYNLLGKNTEQSEAAVLFYTTTNPFCQNISYSTDDFETIEHYEGNPVVPNIFGGNRDPKVIFCKELGCYIMALWIDGEEYCILKSENLTQWSEVQRIVLEGDNECPDIFPLEDGCGNRRWVFMGARDRYLIGTFREGRFVPEQPVMRLYYGNAAYAGQTFSNLDNGRTVRIVWTTDWDNPSWQNARSSFNCQMGFPVELSMERYEDQFYVQAKPIAEIEKIYKSTSCYKDVLISKEDTFHKVLEDAPYMIKINGELPRSGDLECEIFGLKLHISFDENQISMNNWKGDWKVPISVTKKGLDLTILIDRCSIEAYMDNGKIYMSRIMYETVDDCNKPYIIVESSREMHVRSIELHELESIWKDYRRN